MSKRRGLYTENDRSLKEVMRAQFDASAQQSSRINSLEAASSGRNRLYIVSTPYTIQMSAAEESYASLVIPRDLLGISNVMFVFSELHVYNVSAATNNIILRTRYGGDVLAVSTIDITPLATQLTFRILRLYTKIIGNGTEAAQRVQTSVVLSGIVGTIATTNSVEAEIAGTMAVDSTQEQLLDLSVQHSDPTVLFKTVRNLVEIGFPIPAA